MESNLNKSKIQIKEETPEIAAFRAEIGKSAEKIANSDQKAKRRVGRPTNAELEARKAAEEAQKQAAIEEAVPTEALTTLLQFPFELASAGTGFEGFRLTKDEAIGLAPSFGVVLKKYAPAVDPESVAVGMFGLGLVSIALAKYRAYQIWIEQPPEKKKSPASEPTLQNAPAAVSPIPIPGTPLA